MFKPDHNVTIEAPPPDKTFENFLKYQTQKDEDAEYQDWVSEKQKFKSAVSQQKVAEAGWDSFVSGVKRDLKQGYIGWEDAQQQLRDKASKDKIGQTLSFSYGDDPRQGFSRYQDDPKTTDIDESWTPEGGWNQQPTYEANPNFQGWGVDQDIQKIGQWYLGDSYGSTSPGTNTSSTTDLTQLTQPTDAVTGETSTDPLVYDNSQGYRGQQQWETTIRNYNEVLGRDPERDELTDALGRWGAEGWKTGGDQRAWLKEQTEYKNKFANSYMDNYYSTEFGGEIKDEEGNKTGKYTFNFDKSLLPSYANLPGGGTLAGITGVDSPEWKDSYTGSPQELLFAQDSIKRDREFLYDSGLINLQGNIDKELTNLKVEGQKEITRIGKEGDIYGSTIAAFDF